MKTNLTPAAPNRRNFLRDGLSVALLAGVAVVAGTLARRNLQRLPGQTCTGTGLCRGCAVVEDCGLPSALSFRQATKGNQP
jgi:ferric-dicitrate binding protein FerR (iron transport regulator)